MAVLDTVALGECVLTPLAARPVALDRMAQIYAHVADTATQADIRKFALSRLLMLRVPNGQIIRARHALARMAGVPITDKSVARWTIQLHLSGFPDSATARRAARMLAAQAAPTDYFWIGALAISEGRWTEVGGRSEPSSDTRRAWRRAVRHREPTLAHTRRRSGPTRGSSEVIAPGCRESTPALVRLPVFGNDIQQPQAYLRYEVGKLLFDDGRTGDAERYFRGFIPYDFFYTSRPSCTSAGSPKPVGIRRKR